MAATRQLPAPARHRRRRRSRRAAACAGALAVALSCCCAVRPAAAALSADAAWSRLLAEHHANSTVIAPGLLQLHAHESEGGLLLPPPPPPPRGARGRALRSGGGGDGDDGPAAAAAAALSSSRRRALQAASDRWRDQGRYVVLRNPDMPGSRSSTGQVAIHAVLLPGPGSYRILIAGRNLPKQGPKSAPEPNVYGNVSTIYDAKSGTYRVSENYDTLFCTGHTHAADGTIVAAGGDAGRGYGWMREGRDVVRLFSPRDNRWETLPGVKLSEYRWYPTQVQLPDDRVLIVSGFLDDPGVPTGKPAPSIDVFSLRERRIVARRSRYDLGKGFFTNVTPGYQLYPTVFLMPWTDPDAPGERRREREGDTEGGALLFVPVLCAPALFSVAPLAHRNEKNHNPPTKNTPPQNTNCPYQQTTTSSSSTPAARARSSASPPATISWCCTPFPASPSTTSAPPSRPWAAP